MGKLTTKLIVSIGLLTVCFSAFLYYRTYKLTDRRISGIVEQQAAIALQFNLAIRNYVGTNIRPTRPARKS